jgi:hypothetical protein
MTAVVGLILLVVFAAILVAVLLHLPWPQRLRWLLAVNASAQPLDGRTMVGLFDLQQVTVRCLDRDWRTDGVVCWLDTAGGPDLAVGGEVDDSDVAMLETWRASRTPLLLVTTPDGRQSLHADHRSVVGLQPKGHLPLLPGDDAPPAIGRPAEERMSGS